MFQWFAESAKLLNKVLEMTFPKAKEKKELRRERSKDHFDKIMRRLKKSLRKRHKRSPYLDQD